MNKISKTLITLTALTLLASAGSAQHSQVPPHIDLSTISLEHKPSKAPASKSFSDIEYVVGTGEYFAAVVIDFNDSSAQEAYIWGYRWDGSDTALDAFNALLAADPRLFWFAGTPGGFGTPIYGVAYDTDGDLNPSVSFFNFGAQTQPPATGPFDSADADGNTANDTDDQYESGWNTDGYWGFDFSSDSGSTWGFAPTGLDSFTLTDGDFIGLAFKPGFSGDTPAGWVAAQLDVLPVVAADGGSALEFQTGVDYNLTFGFNEVVTGVDATDLELSGTSAAGATVGTPVQVNSTTWTFPISNLQSGTLNVTLAPDAGDIQDTQSNSLSSYSTSYTVTQTSSVSDWQLLD